MTNDPFHPTTESLDPAECWRLMSTQVVGRVAAMVAGQVEIFPINLGIDGESVVVRTAPGTLLSNLIVSPEVVFETDGVEYRDRVPHAWSTLVRGKARFVESVDEEIRLAETGPQPWQAGVKNELVRIVPNQITGRRFPVTGDTRD